LSFRAESRNLSFRLKWKDFSLAQIRLLSKLSPQQLQSARGAFAVFKQNPFGRRLHAHKIHKLSARYRRTIYVIEIEADLRAIFYVESDKVTTVDIGSHDVYRG
jgi:hypothetical protein